MGHLFLATLRIIDLSYDKFPNLEPYFDAPIRGLADAVRNSGQTL